MKRAIPLAQLAQRAQALHRAGRLNEAVACYTQLLARNPRLAEAHNNLGVALKALGRTEDARGHYEQAVSLKPDYADAHNNLGNVLELLGDP
jgi:Flp pilus assembly protein TadD